MKKNKTPNQTTQNYLCETFIQATPAKKQKKNLSYKVEVLNLVITDNRETFGGAINLDEED